MKKFQWDLTIPFVSFVLHFDKDKGIVRSEAYRTRLLFPTEIIVL